MDQFLMAQKLASHHIPMLCKFANSMQGDQKVFARTFLIMFFSYDGHAYAWKESNYLFICGMSYNVELSNYGNNKPISNVSGVGNVYGCGVGDVYGCGIVLGSTNKLTIFFTFNGILAGEFRGIERNGGL
jgi:hypothetical protein